MASSRVPAMIVPLLWDVDVEHFDLDAGAFLVMERVMSRGSWIAMKWLRARYPRDELAKFLRERGVRALSPRDLAYWSLICDVTLPIPPGGGRPSWAGA